MGETYGLPEPEPTRVEQARFALNEVVAGQSVVRRVVLYVLAAALVITPVPQLGVVPLVLLMATDKGLE